MTSAKEVLIRKASKAELFRNLLVEKLERELEEARKDRESMTLHKLTHMEAWYHGEVSAYRAMIDIARSLSKDLLDTEEPA